MVQAPGIQLQEAGVDSEHISTTFAAGKEHLKTRVSYIFGNEGLHSDTWGISTWYKKVSRSSILKDGTEDDKSNLPEQSFRNKPRRQRGRNKPASDRRRQRRAPPLGNPRRQAIIEGELPDVRGRLSEETLALDRRRMQEATRRVQEELQQAQDQTRRGNRAGIARGDGTTGHVGPFPTAKRRTTWQFVSC